MLSEYKVQELIKRLNYYYQQFGVKVHVLESFANQVKLAVHDRLFIVERDGEEYSYVEVHPNNWHF